MNLSYFAVSNYRSCKKVNLNFKSNLGCLIGVNASGKTNILSAILLLKKICNSRLRFSNEKKEFSKCKVKASLTDGDVLIEMSANIYFHTDERNKDEVFDSETRWRFSNFKPNQWHNIPIDFFPFNDKDHLRVSPRMGLALKRSKSVRGNVIKFIELLDNEDFNNNIIPLMNSVFNFFNNINYYSATQFSNPSQCPISLEIEENRYRNRYNSSSKHSDFIFDLYNSCTRNDKDFKRYLNTISKEGIGLIDAIDFEKLEIPTSTYEIQSGGEIIPISKERSLIVPLFTIDERKFSPNQLSEGTFKTLALLYYLMTDASSLLIVEEPEVCIHHGLLDSIVKLLVIQSKHKPILISTHSDLVLDQLEPENILHVEYIKKIGTSVKPLKNYLSMKDYSALKKYLKEYGNLGEYWKEGGLINA